MRFNHWLVLGTIISACACGLPVHAQVEPVGGDTSANDKHLEVLSQRVQRLSMKIAGGNGDNTPRLLQAPVMRTPNRGENHDGAMWLWLDGEQPVAALSVWNRDVVWYSENTTLTDAAVEVTGWSNATWRAPGEQRAWLLQEERVADSPPARQRTLREISRKFTAREDRLGVKSELRLLPHPLHSYADPDRGVLDGALFAFVLGTDPELLMQIEARAAAGGQRWQVAFSRLASAYLAVQAGDRDVWTATAVSNEDRIRHDLGYGMVVEGKR
jgi:hypothetical protein